MDFAAIRKRLESNLYTEDEEFQRDVNLVFTNAIEFNPSGSQVHTEAIFMKEYFFNEWNGIAQTPVAPIQTMIRDDTLNHDFAASQEYTICYSLLKKIQNHPSCVSFLVCHYLNVCSF